MKSALDRLLKSRPDKQTVEKKGIYKGGWGNGIKMLIDKVTCKLVLFSYKTSLNSVIFVTELFSVG